MLKRKYFFTYKGIPILPFFVIEGVNTVRFKTENEIKKDFLYYLKKILALFKKKSSLKYNDYSFSALSSFDIHIKDKGAIVDNQGNIHTTARSYRNYLKENDLVIKDWSDGSNKPKQQLSNRADIAAIVNKYI